LKKQLSPRNLKHFAAQSAYDTIRTELSFGKRLQCTEDTCRIGRTAATTGSRATGKSNNDLDGGIFTHDPNVFVKATYHGLK